MDFQTVFLIGAPRSGTTWLQHMLGAHPNIVTSRETHLFSAYIKSLWQAWSFHLRETLEDCKETGFSGLPTILTENEFDELIHEVISKVYRKIIDLKPSATTLLEKDPPYSLHIDLIRRYSPEARFIHIIRDGRDVVASLVAASKGWGHLWAPKRIEEAATMWKDHVLGARQAKLLGNPYIEVRYEDLLADGSAVLKKLFDFCLIETSSEDCSAIYQRFAFNRVRSQPPEESASIVWGGEFRRRFGTALEEPQGFFGKGKNGAWKEIWGPYERWRVDHVAGDLLADLGYVDEDWIRTGLLRRKIFSMREATRPWLRQFLRRARSR